MSYFGFENLPFSVQEEIEEFLNSFSILETEDVKLVRPSRFIRMTNQDIRKFKRTPEDRDVVEMMTYSLDVLRMN